jgi:hypothetical protein
MLLQPHQRSLQAFHSQQTQMLEQKSIGGDCSVSWNCVAGLVIDAESFSYFNTVAVRITEACFGGDRCAAIKNAIIALKTANALPGIQRIGCVLTSPWHIQSFHGS